MSENNTNNLYGNLIKPNINYHSQRDDQIHYHNMITWTKKSFLRKAHNNIKLFNKSHCLLYDESLSMAWKLSTHAIYKLLFVYSSMNGILILVQPLEELHIVLHLVSCLLRESANDLQDLPLLRSLIVWLRGRDLILTCTNSS
jgi:hypothetical protein